ncbi:GNAT family N-acetyltransferase [Belliella kenyensis]|uniref:GNAT family N-acetyltransferase n=1 Tax=Belliella kenyensis TaxID=1472724 RepID=A0ABV8ENJ7_9BACT|nr:GNAT family N-acetyltransferase [Belliella kenyensis]MCH7401979.1 GNAT family N-acetyltransferase [Belliella kenyensis]MDN3605143.1 GNAT family N-acetyltransferase [Belliella kenyensis]
MEVDTYYQQQMNPYNIKPFENADQEQIIKVWEKSVLATHDFLLHEDFVELKALVQTINFHQLEVYCLEQNLEIVGFMGIVGQKIEMLFLSPEHIGKGQGRQLVLYAIQKHNVNKVDVNEQNQKALNFYQKLGFRAFDRSEKDDQGKPYPIVRMEYS